MYVSTTSLPKWHTEEATRTSVRTMAPCITTSEGMAEGEVEDHHNIHRIMARRNTTTTITMATAMMTIIMRITGRMGRATPTSIRTLAMIGGSFSRNKTTAAQTLGWEGNRLTLAVVGEAILNGEELRQVLHENTDQNLLTTMAGHRCMATTLILVLPATVIPATEVILALVIKISRWLSRWDACD